MNSINRVQFRHLPSAATIAHYAARQVRICVRIWSFSGSWNAITTLQGHNSSLSFDRGIITRAHGGHSCFRE